MDQFCTNKIPLQINNKFDLIKNNFIQLSNNPSKTKLKKCKTFSNLINRPTLRRINKLYNEKQNLKKQLDQIGKEDSIFSNDKLITNIKLETLDDLTVNEILEETMRKEKGKNKNKDVKKYLSPKKNTKRCLTPLTKTTGKRNKKNYYNKKEENNDNISSLTLELNCNKMPQANTSSTKAHNYRNNKKKSMSKTNQKNLNLFINKPQNKHTKNQIYNQSNNILLTPIPNKNKRSKKINSNSSFSKLNDSCDNTNDSLCLTTVSKITTKTFTKGKSLSVSKKVTTMHFPNKSNIKNKDKLLIEIQKLFTDKIQLYDDTYQKMTDSDKKNCIVFLLDALKEMFTINKIAESKNEDFKANNKTKEKQIQDDKNEIKELKKDIIKLNKIIKTNILMNRKLNQKIDNLKIQLEKEKNKNNKNNNNKNNNKSNVTKRGITSEKKVINKNKIKYRNKVNGFISSDTKSKFANKSMDKVKNNNINIDENNYQCNKDTEINDEMNNKNKELIKKENKNIIEKKLENNLNDLIKEKKGLGNNSDCTNFSDANNGLAE